MFLINDNKPSTLLECLVFYLKHCLSLGQSDRTVEGKESNLRLFIKWCHSYDIYNTNQINRDTLEGYRGYVYEYRKPYTSKRLTKGTMRNRLTAVKIFLERMYYFEIIDTDLASRFDLPRQSRRLPAGYLTQEQVDSIFSEALLYGEKGLRDRAVMETYFATGIRRMELAKINIDDLDRKKNILTIFHGKGDKQRRVPIAERACLWIDFYLKEVRPKFANISSGNTLFLDNNGRYFKEQQLTDLVTKYRKRAGIKVKGACNLFRHSTGTLMHENGADIRHVQEMLGHASISTTQIYTHVTIRKLIDVYLSTHPAAFSNNLGGRHE